MRPPRSGGFRGGREGGRGHGGGRGGRGFGGGRGGRGFGVGRGGGGFRDDGPPSEVVGLCFLRFAHSSTFHSSAADITGRS